jgi:hypothetical protein
MKNKISKKRDKKDRWLVSKLAEATPHRRGTTPYTSGVVARAPSPNKGQSVIFYYYYLFRLYL